MQKHEAVAASRKTIFVNNFIGGIAWALGTTLGLSVIVAILGLIFRQVSLVPVIGNFVTQVGEFVAKSSQ